MALQPAKEFMVLRSNVRLKELNRMTQSEKKVWEQVDRRREPCIGFLQELVRASEGGEEATQGCVAGKYRTLGCDVDIIKYDPASLPTRHEFASQCLIEAGERIAVVGTLKGTGGGRSILFWAHPDSSPVKDIENWEHGPFSGDVENGRLYGWGAADDLQGVAITACALEAILTAGLELPADLILASTPSKRHARGIVAILEGGHTADAAVYLHPAESGMGLRDIKAITSGALDFRITIPGRLPETTEPGHAALFHLAVNPIDKAWVVHQALQALAEKRAREVHHPVLEAAIGRATNLGVTYIHCGDANQLSRTSPTCILAGSIIFPPGENGEDVQAQIIEAVQTAVSDDDWLRENPPQIEWLKGVFRGTEVTVDHPLYQTVYQAILAMTGSEPHNYPLHTGSEIRSPMLQKEIPAVGFGPLAGDSTQTGGHDEWVDVDDYIRAIKVVGSVILDWCGG
jgi:acetylornithine deacetylase